MGAGSPRLLRPRPGEARLLTPPAVRLTHAELLAEVTGALGATRGGERDLRVGLEAELIPVFSDGGDRVPIEGVPGGRPAMLPLVKRATERGGGTMEWSPHGSPRARLPGVGALTFEPGGQLELASEPFTSVDALLASVHGTLRALVDDAADVGITLLTRGMDPIRRGADVPLALPSERYRRQRAHYDRIGPWGADMMVRSAGLHLNLDLGGRPVRRWWLANRVAPLLTALFANSPAPAEAGVPTRRSDRAEQWRHLDPTRTGIFGADEDATRAYLAFALGATDFLGAPDGEPAVAFRTAWEEGADLGRWRRHLTTLFPEVRPRGYLELRCVDALRPAWYAVPLVVAVGLLYDPRALARAEDVLPAADPELLLRAGRNGVRDPELCAVALDVLDIALAGARALGPERVGGATLELVEEFRRRFTAVGRDPGDEEDGVPPFTP